MKNIKKGMEKILNDIAEILKEVSKDEGLYVNYAKIYYAAMKFLDDLSENEDVKLPVDVRRIYEKLDIKVSKEDLNEFMGDGDPQKVNRIIGRISIRPDYSKETGESKKSVYVDEKSAPAMSNYALAHELAHFILNYNKFRYTDEYCIMPMLPKMMDEVVADAFAVFLMIPLDIFLETFKGYVETERKKRTTPITTEEWINYLGSVAAVPYYYVACGYQQIRHVAYLMYNIHMMGKEEGMNKYGVEVIELYDRVKDKLDEETIRMLFQ